SNPESKDSPMRNCASEVWSFGPSRNDEGTAMAGLWRRKSVRTSEVSPEFRLALTQEILRTELIRIKALIGTTALLGVMLWTIYIFEPEVVSRVWMGHLKPSYLYSILVPFILFELWVHAMISRHIRLNHDVQVC